MRYIDLFAGAGGLSEGFIKADFEPVAHVELSESACFTLKTRAAFHYLEKKHNLNPYIQYISAYISRDELYSLIPGEQLNSVICEEISAKTLKGLFARIDKLKGDDPIDLIVGGPPCQAYSLVGRSRDPNNMLHDKRNYLFSFYVKFLERYKPKYFVFENVLGLLSARDESGYRYLDMMTAAFDKAGYKIDLKKLNARDYGVLQNRKRIIIIGKRTSESGFHFQWPDHIHTDAHVSAVFSDLPAIHAGEGDVYNCQLLNNPDPWLIESGVRSQIPEMPVTYYCSRTHKEQDLEIYQIAVNKWNEHHERLKYSDLPERLKTHRNQESFLDRFKVVAEEEDASQTVVAHIAKDGHYYIHPSLDQNRSLTPTDVFRFIETAGANPEIPFFLILDEMNLSHVERYFSDFLSKLELLDYNTNTKVFFDIQGYGQLELPKNLFITGTVNIDETTYMFSPKVLDRANVIEFKPGMDDVLKNLLSDTSADEQETAEPGVAEGFMKLANEVRSGEIPEEVKQILKDIQPILKSVYEELEKYGFEFAFRTAKEIRLYAIAAYKTAENGKLPTATEIADIQILQKILPKIHGNRKQIGTLLEELEKICIAKDTEDSSIIGNGYDLPCSREKIRQMKKKLNDFQYASFI